MEYITLHKNAKNITGRQFGRLTALGPVSRDKRGRQIAWLCQCECGNSSTVIVSDLISGHTKSCGCYNLAVHTARLTKHGLSQSKEYGIWRSIIDRCTNPNTESYEWYGARGISICQEWKGSFQAFYEHVSQLPGFDMENKTLDRIDTEKNYKPGNMRWVTMKEQQRNKRSNRIIAFNGKTQCSSAWAEEVGIGRSTIEYRLNKGWSVERALTTPTPKKSELAARHLERNK